MRSVRQRLFFFPISILVTYGFAPGDLSFGNRAKIDTSRYHRKPRNYWRDLENVTVELRSFWAKVNVNVDEHELPPIPNEAILNHFGRNDLRWAIVTQGGREALAYRLGGAVMIPGKWDEAIKLNIIRQLLDPNNDASIGLSPYYPPLSPQSKQKVLQKYGKAFVAEEIDLNNFRYENGRRWSHKKRRKRKGYWCHETLATELKDYVFSESLKCQRPSIFMPRLSDISRSGRHDIHSAIVRLGGYKVVCDMNAMIMPQEWEYFESFYILLCKLDAYFERFHQGNSQIFPPLKEFNENNMNDLSSLIQKHGGRKMVANRLGIGLKSYYNVATLSTWGEFSFEFALEMITFVRSQLHQLEPSFVVQQNGKTRTINMPTQDELCRHGQIGRLLDQKIMKYGGYEVVGRRLGLNVCNIYDYSSRLNKRK